MKYTGILLILFGLTNIMFPDFIAYIIGWVCVFFGTSILLGGFFWPKKASKNDYVKFWNYKIFR